MTINIITTLFVSALLLLGSAQAVDVQFINWWNGDTFQARVSIVAGKDLTQGWQMLLSFDQPLTDIIVNIMIFFNVA